MAIFFAMAGKTTLGSDLFTIGDPEVADDRLDAVCGFPEAD